MNCSKKLAFRNAIAVSVTLPEFAVLGAGLVLFDDFDRRAVTLPQQIEIACGIARAGKVLCITMGLCNIRGYKARHGVPACRVVSFHA
jgi:ABC-type enterochelin transport system permease subunit